MFLDKSNLYAIKTAARKNKELHCNDWQSLARLTDHKNENRKNNIFLKTDRLLYLGFK